MPEFRAGPYHQKQLLCQCQTVCSNGQVWSDLEGKTVGGAWVSPAAFYCHKKLDLRVIELATQAELTTEAGQVVLMRTLSSSSGATILSLPPNATNDPMGSMEDLCQHQDGCGDEPIEIDPETFLAEEAVADIHHLLTLTNWRILTFSLGAPLLFASPPTCNSMLYVPFDDIPDGPNLGQH